MSAEPNPVTEEKGPGDLRALRPIGKGIWVAEHVDTEHSLVYAISTPLVARMTVVLMKDGDLWVHAPIRLTDDIQSDIATIGGRVRHIVAPNRNHAAHVLEWTRAYKFSLVHAAPGLESQAFRVDTTLTAVRSLEWASIIDQYFIEGPPCETIFLHRPSGTLIVTDLFMLFDDAGMEHLPLRTRTALKVLGVAPNVLSVPRMPVKYFKWSSVVRTLQHLLALTFDRVVPCHGMVVEDTCFDNGDGEPKAVKEMVRMMLDGTGDHQSRIRVSTKTPSTPAKKTGRFNSIRCF